MTTKLGVRRSLLDDLRNRQAVIGREHRGGEGGNGNSPQPSSRAPHATAGRSGTPPSGSGEPVSLGLSPAVDKVDDTSPCIDVGFPGRQSARGQEQRIFGGRMTTDDARGNPWAMAARIGLSVAIWIALLLVRGLDGLGGPVGAALIAALLLIAACLPELSDAFWRLVFRRRSRNR